MEFIDEKLDKYCREHTTPENDLLAKINRETNLEVLQPRMLSGHLQGRFLSLISQLIKPTNILEIGTYTGYSALCLAEGLANGGKLITIDNNKLLMERVKNYFNQSKYASNIDYKLGNAAEIIPTLENNFDLVFIDADKKNYINYFNLVWEKVNIGGVIIADNMLWSGKVIDDSAVDVDTQTLKEYNNLQVKNTKGEVLLLPFRDGLNIFRKTKA